MATSAMGGGLKDCACVNIWAEPGNFPPKRFIDTFRSCTSAYVATLSTSSWTAPPRIHAPSIWISARFVGLRCEHAVCTMRLSFMRYTMAGEEPRALRPVP